jgi:hypothetical protein
LSIAKKHQSEKAPLDGTGGNHAYDHGQSLAREGKFELSSLPMNETMRVFYALLVVDSRLAVIIGILRGILFHGCGM